MAVEIAHSDKLMATEYIGATFCLRYVVVNVYCAAGTVDNHASG